ncbi:MAG: phosphoribosylformylglycinamidine cyclo-ligase [Theionarchaea archaeon]|nr:phosphoribosylformylglycinamidine cyclo-ligase [Theionarchaea archaeon]MBU7020991.1 phosphoribosylformylglycinamidine cyclo-ligase [Theionarchaea archaeon]MBU7034370.1 phosphoribosylformylglycinamidine cyclo-ligase [Theionarchaea archaeon]MBU7040066.1 phosphoribosylformylglycinamidine cyclo-ligase [Theionarchaea archaeon]
MSYAKAGVDINQEERSVSVITKIVRESFSFREGLGKPLTEIGHFSGLMEFGEYALALSTDGVGTKTIVAKRLQKYDTLGIDLVAMCVNDLLCNGVEPMAFTDYVVMDETDEHFLAEFGKGLLEGARQANVVIIGGETATHPNMRGHEVNFDLAGTALGFVKKDRIVTGEGITPGNIVIGLRSSGIHSNGLSLARRVLLDGSEDEETLIALLTPTRIYVKPVMSVLESVSVKGMAHITGGGLLNLKRLTGYGFDIEMPEPPPLFSEIQEKGGVATEEMYKTFNMGIGFVIIVDEEVEKDVLGILKSEAVTLGIMREEKGVHVSNLDLEL